MTKIDRRKLMSILDTLDDYGELHRSKAYRLLRESYGLSKSEALKIYAEWEIKK